MTTRIDPDLYGSDALGNALGSISGPLASGASATPLAPNPQGRLVVDWSARRPVVIVSLTQTLDTDAVTITGTLDPEGAARKLPAITFAPYSEQGAPLALYTPALAAGATSAPSFTLGIEVAVQPPEGPATTLVANDIASRLSFEVLEGNMGKLLFVLLSEKARIRREARQLATAKLLAGARLDALDRIGADLGVLRFQDDLAYDADHHEVKTVILTDAAGQPTVESDADYARRLGIYRPFLLSSPARLIEMLNGPGQPVDPNTGLMSGLGLTTRFALAEQNNPFAIAIRVVGIGSEGPRDNFLAYVRNDILTWLPDTAAANAIHATRYQPAARQADIAALRARLRNSYTFPDNAAVAPGLADALDRLGRVLAGLGHSAKLAITRAQDASAGSRYELGLGVDVTALSGADLDALVAAAKNSARALTDDKEAESLIAAARARPPASAADDPDGTWLFTTCGLQTIHRINATTLYLSYAPITGLVVDGPITLAAGGTADYAAHFYPAEDPAINAALLAGLQSAATQWSAAGQAAWTQLTPADQATAWSQVIAQAANAAALETFAAAGLPAIASPGGLITSLGNVPADMLATVALDAGLASAIRAGDPAAIARLRQLVSVLKTAGLVSAVPLVTSANAVILVVSVLGLPQIGVNLAERRAAGFRWYTVPLGGNGTVKGFGSTTSLRATTGGALAVVCLAYARRGQADPYEVVVDLPDGATLTLKQYEFLMNLLSRAYPVGIQVNTYGIRQHHVDLDGDGQPDPLTASVSKTYRSFQRTRLRGIYEQTP
jgi:hypothetical protein